MDVWRWQRENLLTGDYFGFDWKQFGETRASLTARREADSVYLIFRYRIGSDEWKEERRMAPLAWTACPYGGQRTWFLCPRCGPRVAILYSGASIGCRRCLELCYRCTREDRTMRAMRRCNAIRARLGWEPGSWSGPGSRPKYMREHTYDLLALRYCRLASMALDDIARRFGIA